MIKIQLGKMWGLMLALFVYFPLSSCLLKPNISGKGTSNSSNSSKDSVSKEEGMLECVKNAATSRDWTDFPAVISVPMVASENSEKPGRSLFVLSDMHGYFDNFFDLLVSAKVIEPTKEIDGRVIRKPIAFKWIAGNAILVHAGDLLNKGPDSIKTLKFARELESQAAAAGGQAIFLAGNHEVGFIGNPLSSKFDVFVKELRDNSDLEICATKPGRKDESGSEQPAKTPLGIWLSNRPAAALIGGVYISHSGWSTNRTMEEISAEFQEFVKKGNWDSTFMCGESSGAQEGPLGFFNANEWWAGKEFDAPSVFGKLNARQILFGHDPNAFKENGVTGDMAGFTIDSEKGLSIVNLDTGIFSGDAKGGILKCSQNNWRKGGGCLKFEKLVIPNSKSKGDLKEQNFIELPRIFGKPKARGREERTGC